MLRSKAERENGKIGEAQKLRARFRSVNVSIISGVPYMKLASEMDGEEKGPLKEVLMLPTNKIVAKGQYTFDQLATMVEGKQIARDEPLIVIRLQWEPASKKKLVDMISNVSR